MTIKIIESIGIITYWLIISSIVIKYGLTYFASILLFSITTFYIIIRVKDQKFILLKCILFSIFIGSPLSLIFDYIGTASGSWQETTRFKSLILDVFPFEGLIWGVIYVFFIVLFYEYFLSAKNNTIVFNNRVKYGVLGMLIFLFAFFAQWSTNKSALIIPGFYFYLAFFITIPWCVIFLIKKSTKFKKYFLEVAFFTILSLIYEYTALSANLWHFRETGYIGFIPFFQYKFPIEEAFLIIFAPIFLISIYEYFWPPLRSEVSIL